MAGGLTAFAPSLGASQDFRIEEATIAGFHDAMKRGDVTCRDLIEGYLKRIEAYDNAGPKLNALLTINGKSLEIAEQMDAAFRSNPEGLGPLHCVPVILKDNYNTKDLPTSGGSITLKDSQPARDAFLVERLRGAGAIFIAKSNLTEFAMGGTTISSLGGQTLNPYDLTRTPGGSSGGTGAAIAASFGMAGTGSDTGQSVRSPASAQSLVGIRATRGLLSRRGIMPLSATQDEAGPITRTVEDAARMLDVMAGYDPEDPITAFSIGRIPASYTEFLDPDGLKGVRIGVLRDFLGSEAVHEPVNRVVEAAIGEFRRLGAEVIDIRIPDIKELTREMGTSPYETYNLMNQYIKDLGPSAPVKSFDEVIERAEYHPRIKESILSRKNAMNPEEAAKYHAIFHRRDQLRTAVMSVMGENRLDAILYPHQRRLVAKVGEEQLERNGVLSNGTGFPAITFQGGFSVPDETAPLGVPVGIELLGQEWLEGDLIGYAYAFEQGTKLRKPPASTPPLGQPGAKPQ